MNAKQRNAQAQYTRWNNATWDLAIENDQQYEQAAERRDYWLAQCQKLGLEV